MVAALHNGRYRILGAIGRGGTAEVWEVVDTRFGVRRAIKIFQPNPTQSTRARQEREARVLAQLQHPGVVTVFDTFDWDGRHCVVMERCAESVAQRVAANGPLPRPKAVRITMAVLAALSATHARNIIHRDVKPQNILLTDNGMVKLADFGLASCLDDPASLTATGAIVGSLAYLAPELRRGNPATEASDHYAVAASLAFMLTGTHVGDLFSGDTWERLQELGVPAGLVAWLAAAGAENPDDRAVNGLEHWAQPQRGSLRRKAGSRPRWAVAAVALGLGGASVWLVTQNPSTSHTPYIGQLAALFAINPCQNLPAQFDIERFPSRAKHPRGLLEATDIAVADLDNDGARDMLISHKLGAAVRVIWGDGARPFWHLAAPELSVLDLPSAELANIAVGDIDEDGDLDVVGGVANEAGISYFSINSDRATTAAKSIAHGHGVGQIALTDWNEDGHLDLIILTGGEWGATVQLRLGVGDASFGREQSLIEGARDFAVLTTAHGPELAVLVDGDIAFYGPRSRTPLAQHPVAIPGPGRLIVDASDPENVFVLGRRWGQAAGPQSQVALRFQRMGAQVSTCRVSVPYPLAPRWAGDLDADGVLDWLSFRTMPYSTSSYSVAYGAAAAARGAQ